MAGLLDRIGDRFALLADGDRTAADRHRSLAATVEWSYQLLEERERRVFRMVSVFPGSFTLEAAEAVAGPDAGPGGAASGGLLAAEPAAGRAGWPAPVCDAGDAARLRGRAARRGGRAGAGRGGPGPVRAGGGRAGRRGVAGRPRGIGRGPLAGRRGCHHAAGAHLGAAHDAAVALRLALALAPWWQLRGRLAGQYPLLRQAAERAEAAAAGGAPRRSGSAGPRSPRPTRPQRSAISPRPATPPRTGRRPGR